MIEVVAIMVLAGVALLAVRMIVEPAERTAVSLTFPRTTTAAQATAAARTLAGLLPPWWRRLLGGPSVALELRAEVARITHLLTLPAARSEQVVGALRAAIPGLRVMERDSAPAAGHSLARELRLSGHGALRTDTAAETNAGILAGLVPLGPDERAVIQYVITPVAPLPGARLIRRIVAGDAATAEPESIELRFAVAVRLAATAAAPARSRQLMARLLGAFHPVGTPEARLVRRLRPSSLVAAALRRGDPGRTLLAADELAAVWGVPVDAPDVPGLTLARSRELAPVAAVPRRGLVLGDSTVAEHPRPVAVSLDSLRRGMLITAPTGAGKSTILTALATGLFAHPSRPAVLVIDSKGDLAARDLPDRVPTRRIGDVVLFDPADRERPIGFNLIGGTGEADLLVDHVVADLRARYGAAGLGPRSEDVLRASLTTLTATPGRYTLCEVEPLLGNPGFRKRVLADVEDPVLGSFWAWYGSLSDAARAEVIAPLSNKLRSYTLRRRVRAVIGQTGGLDLAAALSPGRITLVSLAKGTVGADVAALLGAAMTSRLWTAIQARAALPESDRHPAVVICDEFADFARVSSVFADAVAQSRGYAVSWVLAHQHLGQLDRETRTAVLANCRSRLVMQTTADDARAFAREFAPSLKPDDLQGLGAYEAYAAVSTGATVAPPASIRTRPAPGPTGTAAAVRAASRNRHGVPASEVDAAIRQRVAGARPAAPVGETRRDS